MTKTDNSVPPSSPSRAANTTDEEPLHTDDSTTEETSNPSPLSDTVSTTEETSNPSTLSDTSSTTLNPSDPSSGPRTWKQSIKEWAYHIVTSVAVVTLIKWIAFDVYVIPTPSMERSLLVGDFLLVSKLSYGARTPRTPLQIPLTNGTIWGTEIPSFLDWIQLPSYALPGIGEVKRGEMVVFHYPAEKERPPDIRTFYVKRCVGVPADTLSLKDGRIHINRTALPLLDTQQRRYLLQSTQSLKERTFNELGIWEVQRNVEGYSFHSSRSQAETLAEKPFVSSLKPLILPTSFTEPYVFPHSKRFTWNVDQFGPLHIPYKGWRIELTDTLLSLYGSTILDHEELANAHISQGKLYISDQPQSHYTFTKDYYFMMGDNRHNSQDSRYWGLVPDDHIVGKPQLCIASFDRRAPFWKSFRWSRLFKLVK